MKWRVGCLFCFSRFTRPYATRISYSVFIRYDVIFVTEHSFQCLFLFILCVCCFFRGIFPASRRRQADRGFGHCFAFYGLVNFGVVCATFGARKHLKILPRERSAKNGDFFSGTNLQLYTYS